MSGYRNNVRQKLMSEIGKLSKGLGENMMRKKNQLAVTPAQWVRGHLFEAVTGYSIDAQNAKRKNGVWEEGVIWMKAPDGNILYNVNAYNAWVASGYKAA